MARRSRYQTKQMNLLAAYLAGKQGEHVTAGDICEYFTREGESIGTATVYRHLERMVDQGVVAKYTVDGTSGACFEYVGDQAADSRQTCYHCKCEVCGKLIHVTCREVSVFARHMEEHHGFELNPVRTVFYGICADCRQAKENAGKGTACDEES